MLSFIYQQAETFQRKHAMRPNMLYLNPEHAAQLQACFSECYDLGKISELLQIEIVINHGIPHPHMAWAPTATRRAG